MGPKFSYQLIKYFKEDVPEMKTLDSVKTYRYQIPIGDYSYDYESILLILSAFETQVSQYHSSDFTIETETRPHWFSKTHITVRVHVYPLI